MKVIKPGYEIMQKLDASILQHIELCGRVCYKSENKITPGSSKEFIRMLIRRGHEAMLEHYSFSVRFICDRGVSHEMVRHRIASFAQESTRYCNYSKSREVTFIEPCFNHDQEWADSCLQAESAYLNMLEEGSTPQEARSVLPNSLKTELIMTANLREWRHFLKLRTAKEAHPQMQQLTRPLLQELKRLVPVVFDDIIF
jgi:thymidylate synthase (FAD)